MQDTSICRPAYTVLADHLHVLHTYPCEGRLPGLQKGLYLQVLKRDLSKTLADLEALDAQLTTATQQLGAEQVKGDTERRVLGPQAQQRILS